MKLIIPLLAAYLMAAPIKDPRRPAVEAFLEKQTATLTQGYSFAGLKITDIYFPHDERTALAVGEVNVLGVRKATLVVMLTFTDQWIITGFAVRDEGIFRYLKFQ